jgi:hypothetical protein
MEPGMRALVLSLLAGLLLGCMSTTRTREVHCLGTLMMDVAESKEEMESIKKSWRAREYARADHASHSWYFPSEFALVPNGSPIPVSVALLPDGTGPPTPHTNVQDAEVLYRKLMQARARYYHRQSWYTRVANRVQTRFEEDDMLYSVLGTLMTAPASLLFYPIVRWNVRSVLWDGTDPDAPDDPIQQFCLTRLDGGMP